MSVRRIAGAALILVLAGAPTSSDAQTAGAQSWEASRAQLLGLCQDRAAGRAVAEEDVRRLRAEESRQRQAARHAANRDLLTTARTEAQALLNVAQERYQTWGWTHRMRLHGIVAGGPELVARKGGRATQAQKDALLDALDRFEASSARIRAKSVQDLVGEKGDEYQVVLSNLLDAARPLLDAGAKIEPKLLRQGLGLKDVAAARKALFQEMLSRQARFEQGDRAALDGLETVFQPQGGVPPALAEARKRHDAVLTAAKAHDQAIAACEASATKAATAAPAPQAPAAQTPPVDSGATLQAQLDHWAAHATDPLPAAAAGTGYLKRDGWLFDALVAARGVSGQPLRVRNGGLVLPKGMAESLRKALAAPAPVADATMARYGALGRGDSPGTRAALQAAMESGKPKEIGAAYRAIVQEGDEAQTAVDELVEVARLRGALKAAPQRPRKGAGGPREIPDLPPTPAEEELVAAARAALSRRPAPRRTLSGPGSLEAPAVRADGQRDYEQRLQATADRLVGAAGRMVTSAHAEVEAAHQERVAALEAGNRAAAAAHLRTLCKGTFGPKRAPCPPGAIDCTCPELVPHYTVEGACRPPEHPCVGKPPIDLGISTEEVRR